MSYDSNNIFAKILRHEIPCFKVHENEHTLAFMDVMPQSDGHTLVIPKSAAENLFDVEPHVLAELIKSTQLVAQAVRKAFDPPGLRLMQFNFPTAGQTVFHIHFHIIPVYEGAELKGHSREQADKEKLAAHAERIKAALS